MICLRFMRHEAFDNAVFQRMKRNHHQLSLAAALSRLRQQCFHFFKLPD